MKGVATVFLLALHAYSTCGVPPQSAMKGVATVFLLALLTAHWGFPPIIQGVMKGIATVAYKYIFNKGHTKLLLQLGVNLTCR